MRKFTDLSKDARNRLSLYVSQWPTITTKTLAEDLQLSTKTVAAIRANQTRKKDEVEEKLYAKYNNRFNSIIKNS